MKNIKIALIFSVLATALFTSCEKSGSEPAHDVMEGTFRIERIDVENQNTNTDYEITRSSTDFSFYTSMIGIERLRFIYKNECLAAPSISTRKDGSWEKIDEENYEVSIEGISAAFTFVKQDENTMLLSMSKNGYDMQITLKRYQFDLLTELKGTWNVDLFYVKDLSSGQTGYVTTSSEYFDDYCDQFGFYRICFNGNGTCLHTDIEGYEDEGTFTKTSDIKYEIRIPDDTGVRVYEAYEEVGVLYIKITSSSREIRAYWIPSE